MRGSARAFILLSTTGALASCGAGGGSNEGTFRFAFQIYKGGQNVPCDSVKEIEEVEVTVRTADGLTVRNGYPRMADCKSGTFSAPALPSGNHVLDISAKGKLQTADSAVLFNSHTNLTAPSDPGLTLSLQPEVAYLKIGWTFENQELMPCATEVQSVDVLISTGTTRATAFHKAFRCAETPILVPGPLPLDSFTIEVDGYSSEGAPLFTAIERSRTLTRGDNEFTATLMSIGGSLYLDWEFSIRGQTIRACDDPRVGVGQMVATVKSREGAVSVSEHLDCTEARPYKFRAQRFLKGRMLELILAADGAARFKGVDDFTMPDGDRYYRPPLPLKAVGNGAFSITVRTASCAVTMGQSFEIKVTNNDGMPPLQVARMTLPQGTSNGVVEDLAYGSYLVEVGQIQNGAHVCDTRGVRMIDATSNAWDPFVF